jgi:hypothetical protein
MRNDIFWDTCIGGDNGNIRHKVAEFIDSFHLLSNFKDEEYFELEDAIVNLIEENKKMIWHEVEYESYREDFCDKMAETFDLDNYGKRVCEVLPISYIDRAIDIWQEYLSDNDAYFDALWASLLDYTFSDLPMTEYDPDDYSSEEKDLYIVYLKDWFTAREDGLSGGEPVCLDDFVNNELQDEEASAYYKSLLNKKSKNEST